MKRRIRMVIETEGEPDRSLAMILDMPPEPDAEYQRKVRDLAHRILRSTLKTVALLESGMGVPKMPMSAEDAVVWEREMDRVRPFERYSEMVRGT